MWWRKKSNQSDGERFFLKELRHKRADSGDDSPDDIPEVNATADEGGTSASERGWRLLLKYRNPIVIVLLIVTVLGSALSYWLGDDAEDLDTSMMVPEVRTIVISRRNLQHKVQSPGTITYLEKAAVTSKILGRVETLYVDQGDLVKPDDRLAQMETFELELQRKQAEASLNSARAQYDLSRARYRAARMNTDRQIKDLERSQSDIIEAKANYMNARQNLINQQEIYEMGGVSETELKSVYANYLSAMSRYFQTRKSYQISIVGFRDEDLEESGMVIPEEPPEKREAFVDFNTEVDRENVKVAEAALKNAQLEIESIDLLMRESTIVSPLEGVVASRAIEMGEQVQQGEPLFTIVRMDTLVISTGIPEEEVQHIELEQQVNFTVDAREGEERAGTVYRISPIIDVATRTAEIKIITDNPEYKLNPGMFVRCSIITRTKEDAIAIPTTALVDRSEEDGQDIAYVYVVQEDLVLRRKVALGGTYGDEVEVTAGLEGGEEIVQEDVQALKDGAAVHVSKRVEQGEDARAADSPEVNDETNDDADEQ
ncbi:MAG: efflux RND transporter periplasmic adaptor subunit [Leptospiraceae bacterium]|nr:efflux RND transporter periplasmic adaptor subunit [Leptospiraceae bacterium]